MVTQVSYKYDLALPKDDYKAEGTDNDKIQSPGSWLAKLETEYNIKSDTVGLCDWLRDKNKPAISAHDLFQMPIDLNNSKFRDEYPERRISFTFKEAVQFVLDTIKHKSEKYPNKIIPLSALQGSITDNLLNALTNIEVPKESRIPSPPQYEPPLCSSQESDNRFWLGSILSILHDSGEIREYGRKGTEYWVNP